MRNHDAHEHDDHHDDDPDDVDNDDDPLLRFVPSVGR